MPSSGPRTSVICNLPTAYGQLSGDVLAGQTPPPCPALSSQVTRPSARTGPAVAEGRAGRRSGPGGSSGARIHLEMRPGLPQRPIGADVAGGLQQSRQVFVDQGLDTGFGSVHG